MALSKKRQQEIMRLVAEGGEELTEAMSRSKKETDRHLRQIRREITCFLKACQDKEELDFFAQNWNRDGNEKPIHHLIKNPYVDAGTLLRVFWYSDPEYYYLSHRFISEVPKGFDRDVFTTLIRIERRIVKSEFKTASIPCDPATWISMEDRRSEFARQIPDVMYQPITGRK